MTDDDELEGGLGEDYVDGGDGDDEVDGTSGFDRVGDDGEMNTCFGEVVWINKYFMLHLC